MTSLFGWPLPADYDVDEGTERHPPICVAQVLQARDEGTVSVRAGALLTLPPPLECEAISSWASRAALGMGLPLPELMSYLGWGGRSSGRRPNGGGGRNLDLWLGECFSDMPFRDDELFYPLEHARQLMAGIVSGQWAPAQVLLGDGAEGRYRFCPMCLGEDRLPYFRQEWRFEGWRACWKHDCLMEDHCPSCGKHPSLPFSMLYAADHRGVGMLDECRYCGELLSSAKPVRLDQAKRAGLDSWGLMLLQNGRALIAALRLSHVRVQGLGGDAPQPTLRAFVSRALLPKPATAASSAYPPLAAEFRQRLASVG